MCKRSGSAASPDMKDSVTKFKIPQTGANYGRASPLASSSESQLWVQRDIWHRRRESRLNLDLHVTITSNYGCSEVRFRQYAEKREDFSPNLFQDEYSTEDCNLSVTCKRPEHTQWHGWVEECWYHNAQTRQVITIIASELTNIDYQIRPTNQPDFSSLRDRRSEDQDNPNF